MPYNAASHTIWTREMNRVMTHAMYRAHVSDEQGLDMLRSLNDYFDVLAPRAAMPAQTATPERSPTPSPIDGHRSELETPQRSVTPERLHFLPPQLPQTMANILEGSGYAAWMPNRQVSEDLIRLVDDGLIVASQEALLRIRALYSLCNGESVRRITQHTDLNYQNLRSMSLTLNKVGATQYIEQLCRRY